MAHQSFYILGIDLLGFHVFLSILADAHLCSYFYAAILFYLLDVYVLNPFLWCIILTFLYSCAANVFLIKPDHLSYFVAGLHDERSPRRQSRRSSSTFRLSRMASS